MSMPPAAYLSYAQLQAIFDAFPDPVFLLTRSGLYAGVHGGSDSRYYHDGKGLIGKRLHEVLKPNKADWFLAEIAKALSAQQMHIVEYDLAMSDVLGLTAGGPADSIWFEGRVQPLNFKIANEDAVLWIASNINHRINLEMQLTDAMRREREAINILWRRIDAARSEQVQTRWTLDVVQARLSSSSGVAISLTNNETLLLAYLVDAQGSLVSKATISEHLFSGFDEKNHDRITVALSRLRSKLKKHQCDLTIRSVFGKGIALLEPVSVLRGSGY